MKEIYVAIYCLPVCITVVLLIVLGLLWYCICRRYQNAVKWQKILIKTGTGAGLFLWLAVILHITIFSRQGGTLEVHRELFYQLRMYYNGGPRELLRTLWMNVLLFIPGGLLLEALWPQNRHRWGRVLLTVLSLSALSAGVEMVQYKYALGCVEADDVLCNTLGAVLGVMIHEISWNRAKCRTCK